MTILVPAFASADAITERSIALSSAVAAATGVQYEIKFTPKTAGAAAMVVDVCSESPLIGEDCTGPVGFSLSGASASGGYTLTATDANTATITGTFTEDTAVTIPVAGVVNPTAVENFYVRMVTYDTQANANLYTSTNRGTGALDEGSVALSTTEAIGVSGAVLESMTFCISGESAPDTSPITANCGGTLVAPTLKLGELVGDVIALQPGVVSTGNIHTQLSTNAVGGAVVSLKSNALNCGGLLRAGAPTACNIAPALSNGVTGDVARFGVMTSAATATTGVSTANGTLQPYGGSGYSNSAYALNYASGNATGVTSPYGDPFLDTNSAPLNNQNMKITFAASATNSTPAGLYSADLSMIATGKF